MSISTTIRKTLAALTVLVSLSGCNSKVMKNVGPAPSANKPGSGGENKAETKISFLEIKTKILNVACARCHFAGSPDGDFTTYGTTLNVVVPGQSARSLLFTEVQSNDMPKRGKPLTDVEKALIRDWIDGGAPEFARESDPVPTATPAPAPKPNPTPNATPLPVPKPQPTPVGTPVPAPKPPPVPTPTPQAPPTFVDVKAKIFDQKCIMCHSDAKRVANFSLENYDLVVADARLVQPGQPLKSGIYVSVTDDFMPSKRAVKAGLVKVLTLDEKAMIKAWIEAGAQK